METKLLGHPLRAIAGRMARLRARFRDDRRGSTAVEAIVMLPIMLAGLYLGMLLWQTINVRRSLHTGTYLATRYLSLYPPNNVDTDVWSGVARRFVYIELKSNPWVDGSRLLDSNPTGSPMARVEVKLIDGCYDCKCKFSVTAFYPLVVMPGVGGSFALPVLDRIELQEERAGEVLCR
jgi:hypothetical protein